MRVGVKNNKSKITKSMVNDEVVEAAAEANGLELPPDTILNSPVPPADWLLATS